MKRKTHRIKSGLLLVLSLFCGIYFFCSKEEALKGNERISGDGFVDIFNGKDLSGWVVKPDIGVFYVEDSLLKCKGDPRPPDVILTEKTYENFILELDFRMSSGCNSGVFIHAPEEGRQSKTGFELQIQDDYGQEPTRYTAGAMYDLVPPDTNAVRPAGQWNHYRIEMDWPNVRVQLNGIQIHDVDMSIDHIMRYRLRVGFIGLQNHGHQIEFKNIRVKELPGKITYESLFNGKDFSGWTPLGDANWHIENGFIVATQGEGYLVSDEKFGNYEFQALMLKNHTASGGIYYRWLNQDDPGYLFEFYDYSDALKDTIRYPEFWPEYVLPPHNHAGYLVQLLNFDRQAEWRINGSISALNMVHQKIRPGHIALYHTGTDTIRIRDLRIRDLTTW